MIGWSASQHIKLKFVDMIGWSASMQAEVRWNDRVKRLAKSAPAANCCRMRCDENTMSNRLNKWICYLMLHSFASRISAANHRRLVNLIENTISNRLNKCSDVTKTILTLHVLWHQDILDAIDARREISAANYGKPRQFQETCLTNLRRQSPRRVNLIENTMSNRLNKWSVVSKADVRRSVFPRRSLHAINASRQISTANYSKPFCEIRWAKD